MGESARNFTVFALVSAIAMVLLGACVKLMLAFHGSCHEMEGLQALSCTLGLAGRSDSGALCLLAIPAMCIALAKWQDIKARGHELEERHLDEKMRQVHALYNSEFKS